MPFTLSAGRIVVRSYEVKPASPQARGIAALWVICASDGPTPAIYCRSRGLSEQQAIQMIVGGFIEPIVKRLPLEYAVELNRLIALETANAVG